MLSEIKLEDLPSYEIGLERGEARGEARAEARTEANIIRNMLPKFNDQQIHEITGIHLATIQATRAKTH